MRRWTEYFSIGKRFGNPRLWLKQLSFAGIVRAESRGEESG